MDLFFSPKVVRELVHGELREKTAMEVSVRCGEGQGGWRVNGFFRQRGDWWGRVVALGWGLVIGTLIYPSWT